MYLHVAVFYTDVKRLNQFIMLIKETLDICIHAGKEFTCLVFITEKKEWRMK